MIRRFIQFYRPYRMLFCLDMICVIIAGAIDLAFPQLLKVLTNTVFRQSPEAILQKLWWIAGGLGVMYVLRYICNYFVGAWGHIMGAKMESDMRRKLFQQYQKLVQKLLC